jgi:hypothetical protein
VIERNVGAASAYRALGITGMNYIEVNYVNDPGQFHPSQSIGNHYYYIPSAPGQLTTC